MANRWGMISKVNLQKEIRFQVCDALFGQPVMDNVVRGVWVETMIWLLLGKNDWEYVGRNWAPYDLRHKKSGARLEVKQSAVRQPWSNEKPASSRFDIASRAGLWSDNGGKWKQNPGRQADIYVFAFHGLWEPLEEVDHRDPSQWQFFVLPAVKLPKAQKTINRNGLISLGAISAGADTLQAVVMAMIE